MLPVLLTTNRNRQQGRERDVQPMWFCVRFHSKYSPFRQSSTEGYLTSLVHSNRVVCALVNILPVWSKHGVRVCALENALLCSCRLTLPSTRLPSAGCANNLEKLLIAESD